MTEERFDELINLYLDNEIGRSDLGELKHAIKENLVRRRKFERACQLHQAARKALASPGSGERRQTRGAGHSSSPAENRSPASRKPGPGSLQNTFKSKQSQAHRNASTGALAERQEKQGAASTVELDQIDLGSRSGSRSQGSGETRNFTFFDSRLGFLVALFLSAAGCLGLYFILRAVTPDTAGDQSGKYTDKPPSGQLDIGSDPKAADELAAEVKKLKVVTVAADPMRDQLYQSALTGQSAGNPDVDYFSSHVDPITTSSTAENVGTNPPSTVNANPPADETPAPGTGSGSAPQP